MADLRNGGPSEWRTRTPERVKNKVVVLTHHCLIGTAPRYQAADCVPVSDMAQRRLLRSVAGHQLVVLMWPSGVFSTRSETVEFSA